MSAVSPKEMQLKEVFLPQTMGPHPSIPSPHPPFKQQFDGVCLRLGQKTRWEFLLSALSPIRGLKEKQVPAFWKDLRGPVE